MDDDQQTQDVAHNFNWDEKAAPPKSGIAHPLQVS